MWRSLKLDSYDAEVSFLASRKEIIGFLKENDIPLDMPREMSIIIKSKLFSLDSSFSIVFNFNIEKLIAISIFPEGGLEGEAFRSRYNKIQKALEKELGYPNNPLRLIMNLLNPNGWRAYWYNNGTTIEHYILDRFGMEEFIDIHFTYPLN